MKSLDIAEAWDLALLTLAETHPNIAAIYGDGVLSTVENAAGDVVKMTLEYSGPFSDVEFYNYDSARRGFSRINVRYALKQAAEELKLDIITAINTVPLVIAGPDDLDAPALDEITDEQKAAAVNYLAEKASETKEMQMTKPNHSTLFDALSIEDDVIAYIRKHYGKGISSEASEAMLRVCLRLWAMLNEKNRAYGNSALDPVRIFSKADATEQLRVRIDDKISRLMRGSSAGEDAEQDLAGYLVILFVAKIWGKCSPA